jgi:hypothetical protein
VERGEVAREGGEDASLGYVQRNNGDEDAQHPLSVLFITAVDGRWVVQQSSEIEISQPRPIAEICCAVREEG